VDIIWSLIAKKVAISPYGYHYHLLDCKVVAAATFEGIDDFHEVVSYELARMIRNHHGRPYVYCRLCWKGEKQNA
jgi:hypothetical protein